LLRAAPHFAAKQKAPSLRRRIRAGHAWTPVAAGLAFQLYVLLVMLVRPLPPSVSIAYCAQGSPKHFYGLTVPADFHPLVDSITYSDYYLLANDFADYIATQDRVDQVRGQTNGCERLTTSAQRVACVRSMLESAAVDRHGSAQAGWPLPSHVYSCLSLLFWRQVYRDKAQWTRMSIMSTAGSGFFSSDRTIAEVGLYKRMPCALSPAWHFMMTADLAQIPAVFQ